MLLSRLDDRHTSIQLKIAKKPVYILSGPLKNAPLTFCKNASPRPAGQAVECKAINKKTPHGGVFTKAFLFGVFAPCPCRCQLFLALEGGGGPFIGMNA